MKAAEGMTGARAVIADSAIRCTRLINPLERFLSVQSHAKGKRGIKAAKSVRSIVRWIRNRDATEANGRRSVQEMHWKQQEATRNICIHLRIERKESRLYEPRYRNSNPTCSLAGAFVRFKDRRYQRWMFDRWIVKEIAAFTTARRSRRSFPRNDDRDGNSSRLGKRIALERED